MNPREDYEMATNGRPNLLILFLLFLGWLSADSQAQGPDEILWLDAAHTRPYVIPESVLNTLDWSDPTKTDLSSLPLEEHQRAYLRDLVSRQQKSAAREPCIYWDPERRDSFGFGPKPHSKTLAELVREAHFAGSGRVVRLLPSWSAGDHQPYTWVFLKLDAVLTDIKDRFGHGDEASYLLPFGEIRIGPARACAVWPDLRMPAVGDHLLLLGYSDPVNLQSVFHSASFEIRDGKVLPGGNIALRSLAPVPLAELHRELDSAEKAEE